MTTDRRGEPPRRRTLVRFGPAAAVATIGLVLAGPAGAETECALGAARSPGLAGGVTAELAAGKFLVASPNLRDTHFARTVVVLLDYDRNGAMGLIINRRTTMRLSDIFPKLENARGHNVFEGGPVGRNSLLMLVRSATAPAPGKSLHVFADVHLSTSEDLLGRMVQDAKKAADVRVYSGYAGWAPGQLDGELARDDWYVVDPDTAFVFDADPEKTWDQLLPRDPLRWTGVPLRPEGDFLTAVAVLRSGVWTEESIRIASSISSRGG